MTSLAVKPNTTDLEFLYKLVNGSIDFSELLHFIHFNVSQHQIDPLIIFITNAHN